MATTTPRARTLSRSPTTRRPSPLDDFHSALDALNCFCELRHDPTRQSLDTATPRDAVTHFEVVELLPRHALLEVRLETGRTHQIRVHLAAIDLRVAGDPVYGPPGELGLERQFLHAARLGFPHPMSGERVETESPLPPDLEEALARAQL